MVIGVAIIGSGIFAKEEHLPAVQASSRLMLKAVYSRSLKSAQSLSENLKDVNLYSDDSGPGKTYYDLLLCDDIQAVIIVLPIMKQAEFIEAALAAGKHVLSEKPIAETIQRAERLLQFSKSNKVKGGVTWSVAENYRYVEVYRVAAAEVKKLGKILGFRVQNFAYLEAGNKYFETPWRKVPEHPGGFLLDGGMHFIAATRLLLGETKVTALSAFTTLLQPHLPPADTLDSIWQTSSSISGSFAMSFGTTLSSNEYKIACEKGTVTVIHNTVTVCKGEERDNDIILEQDFPDTSVGVLGEVEAWAKSLEDKPNPMQSPQQGLANLEILEMMLVSSKKGGTPVTLQHQI